MRVLAVAQMYPPRSRVGAWLATHQFLRRLVDRGHDVAVATTMTGKGGEVEGVPLLPGAHNGPAIDALAAASDVVATHLPVGATAAAKARKPCVQMAHGAHLAVFPGVALVVANSATLAESLTGSPRTIVCHPYVDPAAHRVETTGEALTLVNCSPAKGVKPVWRIAERLPRRPFLAVQGGYGDQIRPRARNVQTWPMQQDMRLVWSQTRILLMPSAHETWGMTAIEAALNGIPVIAHPTPGLRESLGNAGIFADRDDIDGWLTSIGRLDDPDEYEAASAAVRARAVDMPDHRDRFADALEALL
jgi:glycosyltransferase involved in cell wall biosynthesis